VNLLRRHPIAIALVALLLVTAIHALPPLVDAVTGSPPGDVELVRPALYVILAPLSDTLDALTFLSLERARWALAVWALALAGLCASLVNGTFAVILTGLFPTRVRFSGVALGFNVAFTIFSGTAPLVATSLVRATGMNSAPAFVMVGCALVTLASSLGLPRSGRGTSFGAPPS